jgi:astacin (peptidase family M12A)
MATKRNKTSDYQSTDEPTEFKGSPNMGVAVISGATFQNKSVTYYEADGMAMVEGDIALGTVEAVKKATEQAREAVAADPEIAFSVGIPGSQFRWPNCRIPYEIDPNLPNQQRVTDAIAHWESRTPFRFPLRTAANSAQFPNYVRFTDAGGCWSMVGMQGGQQTISLGAGCTAGNAIHEIGHTVGLWHEQSREDRDLFVTINWQNIQSGMSAQFNQHITDGDDLGAYDYGSIMHYPRTAFSANGQETITPTNPAAQIGQRNGLSAGDIAGVRAMYPSCFGVVKSPFNEPVVFKKVVDDPRPFKKIIDDNRFKKLRDDPFPKWLRDPIFRPPIVTQPGTLQPFSIATTHHAPFAQEGVGAEAMADPNVASYVSGLEQQLLDVEAAVAEARARAARANADAAKLQEQSTALAAAYEQMMNQLGGGT